MQFPERLKKGDLIRAVAPSGPFDASLLREGFARVAPYRLELPPDMAERQHGFLAGSDKERLQELQEAFDCPRARAIWVARGGYGMSRILEKLSFEAFHKNPKWVIGFSDTTALLQRLYQEGYASLHGPNGTTLSRMSTADLSETLQILGGQPSTGFSNLGCLRPGKAEGRLIGGNLTVLCYEAVAGRLRLPEDAILFLEDVSETSYRLDRMLHSLIAGGHLSGVRAVVLGEFTDCSSGKFNVLASEVVADNLRVLDVPLLSGLPSGHGKRNAPLIMGSLVSLDAQKGTLCFDLP